MDTLATVKNDVISAIEGSVHLQPSTRDKYRRAVALALDNDIDLRDTDQVIAFAETLSASVRNNLKSAIRIWSARLSSRVKSGATPENIPAVTATLYRLEALNEAIQVKASNGQKSHTWLSQTEVRRLLATCDESTLPGKRDKLALGLLTGAGLRRAELAALQWSDVKEQPVKGKFRTVLDIKGKGAKSRVVPISDRLAAALDAWAGVIGREGYVIRSLGMNREPGDSISAVAIFNLVRKAGAAMGRPELAAHDLRRTYAQLGYEAGIPITQISTLLGHSSVATTQRYLNLDLDLETTVSDFIPFE